MQREEGVGKKEIGEKEQRRYTIRFTLVPMIIFQC